MNTDSKPATSPVVDKPTLLLLRHLREQSGARSRRGDAIYCYVIGGELFTERFGERYDARFGR